MVELLLGYILIREFMYYHHTHKLLNKLMSRNYQEYQFSQAIKPEEPKPFEPVVIEENDQDFARLRGLELE